MIEFAAFFVMPFDENMPRKETDAAIEYAKKLRVEAEEKCLREYHALVEEDKKLVRRVWAQSRIDFEMRAIGVSLRMPIEKGADKNVVATVVHDDFLYWDINVLLQRMEAMNTAVTKVAQEYGATPHVAFSDVRYRV